MHLSLIIPAYNEEDRIGDTLVRVCDYLAAQDYESEVIVVDDGSRDRTRMLVEASAKHLNPSPRLVSLPANWGKGAAVRRGMLDEAVGEYRVYYDADGSTPIEELARLWPAFAAGADIVIGSRALPESEVVQRQCWLRQSMGRINNTLLRLLGVTRFKDTQCGFKGFTALASKLVFPRQTIQGFSFDAELLYIAEQQGLEIVEIPIRWENSPDSRVNPVTDAARMLWDLFIIRLRGFTGRYR